MTAALAYEDVDRCGVRPDAQGSEKPGMRGNNIFVFALRMERG